MSKDRTTKAINPLMLVKEGWFILVPNLKVLIPAILLVFVIVLGFHYQLMAYFVEQSPDTAQIEHMLKSSAIIGLVFSPFEVAIMMLGVKAARKEKIQLKDLFEYLPKAPMIIIVTILTTALIQLGLYVIIPGIFLLVSLSMTQLLLCDKKYSMIKSMIESVRVISKNWFNCTSVYLLLIGLILLSLATMGIALLITIPLYVCVKGAMYNQLFGADELNNTGDNDTEFEA